MFLSGEEVLLTDALFKLIKNQLTEKSFVECVLEIVHGLSECHDKNDQVFWRKKISHILLNNVVNEDIINNSNQVHKANLTWRSFFSILNKCQLWSSLFSLLFSLPTLELFGLITTKWKTEAAHNVSDNAAFCIAMLSSFVLSTTTVKDTCILREIEKRLLDFLEELLVGFSATKLNIISPDQKKNLVLSVQALNDCFKNASIFNVNALHMCDIHNLLTSNMYVNATEQKKVDMLNELSRKQTAQDTSVMFKDFLQNTEKKLQEIVLSLGHQPNTVASYLTDICTHLTALVNLRGCDSNINATDEADNTIDNSLHCVQNFLPGYEESTKFLLNLLINYNSNNVNVEKCLKCLQKSKECLLRSHHMEDLLHVLSLFISDCTKSVVNGMRLQPWIATLKELVVFTFQNMPLVSKIPLLEFALGQSFLDTQCVDFLGGDLLGTEVTNDVRRQINLVFNKIVSKKDLKEETINSICNVAILSPSLTVSKMTEQIVYHEEHHELFALSLYKLNVLTSFSDKSGNSFFLQALCKYLSDNQSDSVVRNVQKVLCMLLKECKDDWQKQLATELFHTYILPSTSNGNTNALNKVLLINTVELFVSTYINKEAAAVLTFEDLLLLAYAWGIIIESDSTPDDTVLSIKANMPHVVMQAKKLTLIMQSNESTSLLQWAKQLVSSLNWCTQVYFRPIFQHVEGHKLIFPMCLKTVCDITEPDIVFKDCYGEGTGLTAWLQCMVVDPGLLPTSSLKLEFNSVSEQDMFCNGMTVALCQLLPNSTEDEWVTIIEALIALVVDQKLFVQLHSLETHSMPWININECFVPLTIIELLHKVTVFLTSPCCESWMNVHHWCRYAKNYAVNTKNLFLRWIEKEGFTRQSHLFMLFCFFGHTCGLICLFELNKTLNMSKPVDSCFVLTLDLMNEFCKLYSIVVVDNEESESTDLLLLRQSIEHKNQMLNIVKAINNKQIKETLSQKLNKL